LFTGKYPDLGGARPAMPEHLAANAR